MQNAPCSMSAKVFPEITVPPRIGWSAAPAVSSYQNVKSIVLAMFVVAMVIGAFQSAANIASAVYELEDVKMTGTGGESGGVLDVMAIKRANVAAAALATAAFVVSGVGSIVLFEKYGAVM